MGRELTSSIAAARNALWGAGAWVWLVEIASVTGGFFRLCSGREHVTAGGKVYQAGIAEVSIPAEDVESPVGEATIVVPNVDRVPFAYVDTLGDLLGQPATIRIAHTEDLDNLAAGLVWRFKVLRARANALRLELTVGHAAEIESVPSVRFNRRDFPQLRPGQGVRQ